MPVDPLIVRAISIGLGVMFVIAGYHKLSGMSAFRVTLIEYQVLPGALTGPAAVVVPLVELLLGAAWLLADGGRGMAAIGSAILLGVYALAIGINIGRGRVHFDCGCGFGRHSGSEQFLSGGLVLRNVVLIAASLLTLLPVTTRSLGWGDYLTLSAALLAGGLLFAAANQLLANRAAIDTWRKSR